MKRILAMSCIVLLLATSLVVASALPARAAPAAAGDLVGGVTFSQDCPHVLGDLGVGVGIAFDGTDLWYSCFASGSSPDLLRADPITGTVVASYNIAGGLGALAYDATRNAIWAGWGGSNTGNVYLISLDASKTVTGSAVQFTAPGAVVCGLDDGLAFDGQDDTIYISDDCSTTIHHYSTSGTFLGSAPWDGSGCFNSGLAVGGQDLFEGSDGCSHVWVVDKVSKTALFDFNTAVAGDPNFRDEDLECDINTFASLGKQVMWSKEAYSPMRAHAFEIPGGTCGIGGLAAGTFVIGDQNAGLNTNVNWWGAQWAKNNSLSGGGAPNAFKGFALNITGGCGGTWTTDPGNSPPPPAGIIPPFIAVIVSSTITQSGSTISGDILHIVLVKTDPGYANDPGHPGTGTVVQVLC